MIAFLQGNILFSDGNELIIKTGDGVGYQVFYLSVLIEDEISSIYISQVVRENAVELYGFKSLSDKKMFEMLTSVKGVGPKSAFYLVWELGSDKLADAIYNDIQSVLSSVSGVGKKTAAQIVLDLKNKIKKAKLYSMEFNENGSILEDALIALKELGFKENVILSKIQSIMKNNKLTKAEQIVHMVLKDL